MPISQIFRLNIALYDFGWALGYKPVRPALTCSHSSHPRFTMRLSPQLSKSVRSIRSSPPKSSPNFLTHQLLWIPRREWRSRTDGAPCLWHELRRRDLAMPWHMDLSQNRRHRLITIQVHGLTFSLNQVSLSSGSKPRRTHMFFRKCSMFSFGTPFSIRIHPFWRKCSRCSGVRCVYPIVDMFSSDVQRVKGGSLVRSSDKCLICVQRWEKDDQWHVRRPEARQKKLHTKNIPAYSGDRSLNRYSPNERTPAIRKYKSAGHMARGFSEKWQWISSLNQKIII